MMSKRNAKAEETTSMTLKDLIGGDLQVKLKAKAEELRKQETAERERKRLEAEERRKQEQKRLDNDFEHLLNNSKLDWKKFK